MCKECEWEDLLKEINDCISDDDFEWAEDTLLGIAETVEERKHATEGQKQAVGNIRDAVERRGK